MHRLIKTPTRNLSQFQTLIIGGGTGGMAMLHKMCKYHVDRYFVGLVEPNTFHYYQPLWTLVGGGEKKFEDSEKRILDMIHVEAFWYQNMVTSFHPDDNYVTLIDGTEIEYKNLIVSAGLNIHFNKIKGLEQAIYENLPGICSNYAAYLVEKTFPTIRQTAEQAKSERVTAIFTQPNTPIKCGGGPQKIAYLAEDYFKKCGVRDNVDIIFNTGMPTIFPQPDYAESMRNLMKQKGIMVNYNNNLESIDGHNKLAKFSTTGTTKYDMIHIVPPMGPFDFIKNSNISNSDGWVDVNKHTLQHNKYNNIWSLGDCSSLPTSKTAAAVAAQTRILYHNLTSFIEDDEEQLPLKYDGYTACPLVTSYKDGLIAEFDYDLKRMESTPLDQRKVYKSFYYVKKEILPKYYFKWHVLGKWEGPFKMRMVSDLVKSN